MMSFDTINLPDLGGSDIFIIKLDENGNIVWVKVYGGASNDRCRAITGDNNGSIYLTGNFENDSYFDSIKLSAIPTPDTISRPDIFVAKLDTSGVVRWAHQSYGTANNDWEAGKGITVDQEGNIYITGVTSSATFDSLTILGDLDPFLAKYDSSGKIMWVQNIGDTPAWSEGYEMAIDDSANLYITGFFQLAMDIAACHLASTAGSGVFVTKYDSSGVAKWANQTRTTAEICCDYGWDIATTSNNDAVIVGIMVRDLTLDGIVVNSADQFSGDVFVAKIGNSGNCPVGAIELLSEELKGPLVFPNPSTGSFKITTPPEHLVSKYILYDWLGRVIEEQHPNSNIAEIHLNSYASGVYVLSVELNGVQITNHKVILYNGT